MKNQDIHMLGSTFQGGMMMNLDKTLYFNPRNNPTGGSRDSGFDGGPDVARVGMNISSDMKVSSLLQNKNLDDLVADETSLSHGGTAHVTAQ